MNFFQQRLLCLCIFFPLVAVNTALEAKKRHIIREEPKRYIMQAIDVLKTRNGKTIVEIGSMRTPLSHPIGVGNCGEGCLNGHSTMWWATTNATVYSVDIDSNNTRITQESCKSFKNVHAVTQDGITFLKNFKKPIDLLFLDAWDLDTPLFAEHHLEAYLAAKPKLHAKSLILIDDTDVANGGKGRLVIPQAINDGYKIIFAGRQTLLAK